MEIRLILVVTALVFLAACASGGYSRAYIISDTVDEAVSTEPVENR
jgi:hypothetical protein